MAKPTQKCPVCHQNAKFLKQNQGLGGKEGRPNMNTMTIQSDVMARLNGVGLASQHAEKSGLRPGQSRCPAWLPAPPERRPVRGAPMARTQALRPLRGIWLGAAQDPLGDRILMAVLALCGLAAIAYGFSSMLDLVQNWSVFNAWVGQIIR